MKKCPYCAEEIQDEAIVCKHCGRDLTAAQPPRPRPVGQPVASQPRQGDKKTNLGLIILICVIGGIMVICCAISFQVYSQSNAIQEISATAGISASGHTVTYLVEGTVPVAFVTYFNADGGMEQKDVTLPFTMEFNSSGNPMLSLVAQNKSDNGSITCKILIDGQVKKQASSSGAYVIVTCADVAW